MIRLALLFFLSWSAPLWSDTLRMAVTTSFQNSGLAEVLLPRIAADTGVDVQLLVVGTGQALRLGQAGDVDAVLVHSRQAEIAFVAAGHATRRTELMYNDFVLVGPKADPAGAAGAQTASDALRRIQSQTSRFVSRGDDSGTHRKEISLWQEAGFDPDQFGRWYAQVGAGMGASLNTAAGLDAYILTDRASWLNFKNKARLSLLFQGDPVLFNQYTFLPINPARHPHIDPDTAVAVEAWLTSDAARELINGHQIAGEQLFQFNANETR